MRIFEYQCERCLSVFEQALGVLSDVKCINCGSDEIVRSDSIFYYPNKQFCPKEDFRNIDDDGGALSDILRSDKGKCGGCYRGSTSKVYNNLFFSHF